MKKGMKQSRGRSRRRKRSKEGERRTQAIERTVHEREKSGAVAVRHWRFPGL